jgi:dihydroxy-acid dehydratase
VGMRFNTIGVSDGISMGTEGMSFSLQSREIIADSIETVMGAQWYDANISMPGCDKNMPGCLMAMAGSTALSLMVYGGTIRRATGRAEAGHRLGLPELRPVHRRRHRRGERQDIVRNACPGAGACGGMYTANTMASAIEALGMSLPYSSSYPAEDPASSRSAARPARPSAPAGAGLKPRDIMTREAFENAITVVIALGGSTNVVLHLLAMARAVDVPLTLDDFQRSPTACPSWPTSSPAAST